MTDPRRRRIGLHTGYPSPLLLDLAAQAGFDFVWLDAEHTGLQPADCAEAVARLSPRKVEVLVRVPNLDPDLLTTYANTGVDEVVLPRIRTMEEFGKAANALQYAPAGTRSRQVVPATRYGADWDRKLRLSVIVETVDSLAILSELAADENVYGIWLGPRDMADDHARREIEINVDDLIGRLAKQFTGGRALLGINAVDEGGVGRAFAAGADRCTFYWDIYLRDTLRRLAGLRPTRAPGSTST